MFLTLIPFIYPSALFRFSLLDSLPAAPVSTIDMDPPNSELDPMLNLGANFADDNPMERFVLEISYPQDPYLYAKYNNQAQHSYAQHASMIYRSNPPPDPNPSSSDVDSESTSEKSWDSDEEDLERERLYMQKELSLYGQAFQEVSEHKVYFVRCKVRLSDILCH